MNHFLQRGRRLLYPCPPKSFFNSQSVFHNIGHRVISKSLSKCSFSISGFQHVSPGLFFEGNSNSLGVGFSCGSGGKESACNVGNLGLIPGLGRSPGEGKGYPLQYSGLHFHGVYSQWSHKQLGMTEQLSFTH